METWGPRNLRVKSDKRMHIPQDAWTSQLGRTGQLISEINFFLKAIKSFIKDLYAVCQSCDNREEPSAASETSWTSEHEGLRIFLRHWTPLFYQRLRQNDRLEGALVKALASQQCDAGSISSPCLRLSFFVDSCLATRFFLWIVRFSDPPFTKINIPIPLIQLGWRTCIKTS